MFLSGAVLAARQPLLIPGASSWGDKAALPLYYCVLTRKAIGALPPLAYLLIVLLGEADACGTLGLVSPVFREIFAQSDHLNSFNLLWQRA